VVVVVLGMCDGLDVMFGLFVFWCGFFGLVVSLMLEC